MVVLTYTVIIFVLFCGETGIETESETECKEIKISIYLND